MKPLLIGQAPGPRTDPKAPLSGRCGSRLAELCRLELADFVDRFERVNLIERFPGKAGKGDRFQLDAARRRAIHLLLSGKLVGRRVVLLGGNVARTFGLPRVDLMEWQLFGHREQMTFLAVCPHPSGVSRWWNDPRNLILAQQFWTELAKASARPNILG